MQLGLWTTIRPADDLPRLADQVAAMGFSSIQAHFPDGCDEGLARRLGRATAAAGISVAAVSGYANPLRPDEAPMGWREAELAGLVALMPLLDARVLVSSSGTYADDPRAGHPDSASPAAWDALRRSVDRLFPHLDAAEAILALDPLRGQVLGDLPRVLRFCEEVNSPYLGVVLDPPGLLSGEGSPDHPARLAALTEALAPHTRLIHLGDLGEGPGRLVAPGEGWLDYPALLGAIARADLSAPAIITGATLDRAAAARRFVLSQSRISAP